MVLSSWAVINGLAICLEVDETDHLTPNTLLESRVHAKVRCQHCLPKGLWTRSQPTTGGIVAENNACHLHGCYLRIQSRQTSFDTVTTHHHANIIWLSSSAAASCEPDAKSSGSKLSTSCEQTKHWTCAIDQTLNNFQSTRQTSVRTLRSMNEIHRNHSHSRRCNRV